MSELQINNFDDARSAEKIEFLIKEVIKLKLKIKDLEINNLDNKDLESKDLDTKNISNEHIMIELNKKTINWDTLPIVLF